MTKAQKVLTWIAVAIALVIILGAIGSCGMPKDKDIDKVSTAIDQKVNQDKAKKEYRSKVVDIMKEASGATSTISDLFTEKPYPILWTTTEKVKLATAMVIIENLYDKIYALVPPDSLKPAHDKLLEGLKKYKESMGELTIGIDEMDASKINKATKLLEEGTDLVKDATNLIK